MTKPPSHPSTERPIKLVTYLLTGAVTLAAIVAIVAMPQTERFHAKGPANTGHAALACADCQTASRSSARPTSGSTFGTHARAARPSDIEP